MFPEGRSPWLGGGGGFPAKPSHKRGTDGGRERTGMGRAGGNGEGQEKGRGRRWRRAGDRSGGGDEEQDRGRAVVVMAER